MSNELATTELLKFTPEQTQLIKTQIAKDCTNDELSLFLYQCKRTGLDPLTRQIYAIKRSGRMTIQTSIDGFRVIAERSGTYAGQDEPIFTYKDDGKSILKCAVTVYRFAANGQRYPAGVGVAFYDEYYPNPINLQKTLKHTMIAKVAEALALRKAFPQDLSGLYTADEMQQANNVEDAVQVLTMKDSRYNAVRDKIITGKVSIEKVMEHFTIDDDAMDDLNKAQIEAIKLFCNSANLEDDKTKDFVKKYLSEEMTAEAIISHIKQNYGVEYITTL